MQLATKTNRTELNDERFLFRIMSASIALAFGFAFASIESLGGGAFGFSFHITSGTLAAFAVGTVVGMFFWTIMTRDSGTGASLLRRIFILLLLLGGVAGFLYPLRFLSSERVVEVLQGLAIASVPLSLIGFMLWRLKRFFDQDEYCREATEKQNQT